MYKVLDLFCGAGGLSMGFIDEDFEVILGIDNEEVALRTFQYNHPNSSTMRLNLFDHSNISQIENFLESSQNKIDVLVGGPPCQGFSLAGKRDEHDERNRLYEAMVEIARRLNPHIVVLENVPGLINLFNGKAKQRIIEDFETLGYKVSVKILYAPNYGVPQIRKRAFFVCVKGENKFEFPEPILESSNYITARQALSDLPSLENVLDFKNLEQEFDYISIPKSNYQKEMRLNSTKVINHIPTNHAKKTIEHIRMVPEGGNYKNLPLHLSKNFKYHESLTRYHGDRPSRTIDTGHRTHFHYEHDRIPTVRECARLQSFPDHFIFFGNKQQQYRQVGNAVPPKLGRALAKKIKEYLNYEKV